MPPLPAVPAVVKVAVKGHFSSGYNWANALHWTYGGTPPTSASCATLAGEIFTAYTGAFLGDMPTITYVDEVTVTDLSSSSGGEGNGGTANTPGTSSADKLPGNVTTLISKAIAQRYRGGHPRTYLPCGTDENLQDQGHWNSSYVTHILGQWTTFVDAVVGLSVGGTSLGQECAVSYYTTDYTTTPPSRVRRVTPLVYDIPLDGYSAQAEIASQRRRIGRRR